MFIDNIVLCENEDIKKEKGLDNFQNIINKILNDIDLIEKDIIIINMSIDDILSELKKELKDEEKIIDKYKKKFEAFKNDLNNKENIQNCFDIFEYIYSKKGKITEKTKKEFIEIMSKFLKQINETNKSKRKPIFYEKKIEYFKNYLGNLFQTKDEKEKNLKDVTINDVKLVLNKTNKANFDKYSEHSKNQNNKVGRKK